MALALGVTTLHVLAKISIREIVIAVFCFGLIFLAVCSSGFVASGLLLREPPTDPIAEVTTVIGLGITAYGTLLVLVGFLPVLNRPALVVASAILALPALRRRAQALRLARSAATVVARGVRTAAFVAVPGVALLTAAFAAGLRPPAAPDEVAYHWAAPVVWAKAGHWVTTPFRFTNGFHLSAVLYTPAAVFKSPTAAHWIDTLTFVLLMLGAAALARHFGGSGALAASAIVSIPTAFGQSWLAYDDVFGASLLLAACVVVMERSDARRRWTAGVLVAGALSVKPLLILLTPAVLALAILSNQTRADHERGLRRATGLLVPLALPGVVASLGWFAYTKWAIGSWTQGAGLVVSHFGRDPSHGLATIRLPRVVDVLMIPINPLLTTIIGNHQPFGGRTGPVVLLSIFLVAIAAVRTNGAIRTRVSTLAIAALSAYLVASTLIVRTRFLITVYALVVAGGAVAVSLWEAARPARQARAVKWLYYLCVGVGMADTARYLR